MVTAKEWYKNCLGQLAETGWCETKAIIAGGGPVSLCHAPVLVVPDASCSAARSD
jgi:hypothetical protein